MPYKEIDEQDMARFLWTTTREGMAVVNKKGRIQKANPALSTFLGYTPLELEGKHFAEITFSDDIAADMAEFNNLVEGKISAYEMHKRYITKMGTIVPGKLRVTKFFDQICVFVQVLPFDDIITPVHLSAEERTKVFEEMIGELVRKNIKKITLFLVLALGVVAGVVNFDALLKLIGG